MSTTSNTASEESIGQEIRRAAERLGVDEDVVTRWCVWKHLKEIVNPETELKSVDRSGLRVEVVSVLSREHNTADLTPICWRYLVVLEIPHNHTCHPIASREVCVVFRSPLFGGDPKSRSYVAFMTGGRGNCPPCSGSFESVNQGVINSINGQIDAGHFDHLLQPQDSEQ